jgi:hypothetical protein
LCRGETALVVFKMIVLGCRMTFAAPFRCLRTELRRGD